MTDVASREVLLRDVHPAQVVMPDGSIVRGARVFVTSRRALIYGVDLATREVLVVGDLAITEPGIIPPGKGTLGPSESLELRTPVGTAWLTRDRGCGCGSPLKALSAPVGWSG